MNHRIKQGCEYDMRKVWEDYYRPDEGQRLEW
jgi:hypothetical protein